MHGKIALGSQNGIIGMTLQLIHQSQKNYSMKSFIAYQEKCEMVLPTTLQDMLKNST